MKRFFRLLLAAGAAVCFLHAALAQTVPVGWVGVSATNTRDAGIPIVNGTIAFLPVNNSGTPISFRSAGGTGAAATATFGVVIASQSPGSGYSGSWTCAVAGGTFTSQATCTATVSSGGLVFAITSAGTYTAPPTGITFSGGTFAPGTAATTSLSMSLTGTTVTAGGSGYAGTVAQFPGCTGTITSAVTIGSGAVTAISATGGSCPAGTPVVVVGSGQVGPDPWTATVTNGAFYIQVPDSVETSPVNVCYSVTITDNVTGNVQSGPGYGCVQPAGSGTAVTGGSAWCAAQTSTAGGTCNFDTYPPNLAALVVTQQGPTGPAGAAGAAGATGATGATGPLAPSGTPVTGHCANWASSTTIGDAGPCGTTSGGYLHWRTQLTKVLTNTGYARACLVGDSTFIGAYANGTSSGNWIPNAPGTQLANALQTDFGIQASSDAWFGGGNTAGTFPADDSRLSINSAWTPDTTYISIGGPTFKATAAGTLAFTPVGTVNTFRIFYLKNSGAGTISANIDGGSATTQSTSGSAGMGVFTLTASSVGSHTVNVTWASGGQVNIVGIEAYDSTQYRVLVDVLAVGGANEAYLASTTYAFSPGNALPYSTVGCDVVLHEGGINDWQASVSIPSFTTSAQTIITAAITAGADVGIISPTPQSGTGIGTMLGYVNALQGLTGTNSNTGVSSALPWSDDWQVFSGPAAGANYGWAFANALGEMYTDGIHPNGYGYALTAELLAKNLLMVPSQADQPNPQGWLPYLSGVQAIITPTSAQPNGLVLSTGSQNMAKLYPFCNSGGNVNCGTLDLLAGTSPGTVYTHLSAYDAGYINVSASSSAGYFSFLGNNSGTSPILKILTSSNGTGSLNVYTGNSATGNPFVTLGNECGSADCGYIKLYAGGALTALLSGASGIASYVPNTFAATAFLIGSNPIIPGTAILSYSGFKAISGSSSPSDTCSSGSGYAGMFETNASLNTYLCSNASGSYEWDAVGGANYTGTPPIVVSGSAISCPTCVTTGGGGTLFFFQPGDLNSNAGQGTVNNKITGYTFNLTSAISVNDLCVDAKVADNTSNLYDIGIANTSGTLLLHTGAVAGTVLVPNTSMTCVAVASAPVSLNAGSYVLELTTNCASSCATFDVINQSGTNVFPVKLWQSTAGWGTTSGGALPSSSTLPSISYSGGSANIDPWFLLHN